uniref:uncharacterized protein LOC132681782 isoform X2 n=1 Tax=Panthera onca TaxID=9690 RepID=UPI002952F7E1|nr:uncharacterized protein LOC132681782 isoform X2 [Panthera onca]
MAQSFNLFQQDPTVTSSPTEVRVWIEELNYNFLIYGEHFERAKINGEKLLNITRQKLNELGIIQTDHQDIILKAVANINKKNKVERQDMPGEYQNDKKMPTTFKKQSEHLEHAIDCILVLISERRRARILHGINEQSPHNILTATLELINVVKMILNILERPPFDCMSEFSSLKSQLIKCITLLKHFSEQSYLSLEMESDMIDVCKSVNKICHYIFALPPDLTRTETQILAFLTPENKLSRMQVPITTTNSSSELIFSLQDVSPPIEIVPDKFEYFCPERLNTPSNEGAIVMSHDEGSKSETEASDTKISEISAGSLAYKSLQDLKIIESDTLLLESGSERCVIDSDSDRGIGLDSDLEQHSKDSDSIIWGMDSDSEKCLMDSNSVKHLQEAEKYQVASSSMKDLMESEQQLVGVEQCQMDSDSLKHWMDSDSEKCLADSDSEKYGLNSDSERPEMDSDSEKCHMASASVKHLLKAEKCQIASDSVKSLMESPKMLRETKQHWMLSASERYVMDSGMDRDEMDLASASSVCLMGEEKHQEKIRSKRYIMESDSEPCEMDSDSERYGLASTAVKCVMDAKTFQFSTDTEGCWMDSWSERHTNDLDSESPEMVSDSVKHTVKAENCQRASDLESLWMGLRFESKRCWTDSERQKLDFDCGRCWDSSGRYQFRSERIQHSSGKCRDDPQKRWDSFERHQIDPNSGKYLADSENKRHKNEFESERLMMDMAKEQCLIFENKRLQTDEDKKRYLITSDSEQEHKIVFHNERHPVDSENEAQRLGARKKDNRPQGFWRPVFLSSPFSQRKRTEEQKSAQQIDNRVSRIQFVRYLSDDKIVRFKEVSPTLNDNQKSQQKLKEEHSQSISDPNTFTDNKYHRNRRHKISVCKSCCNDYQFPQNVRSSQSQMNPLNLLNAEDYTSKVSALLCHPMSMSPQYAVHPKTHRNNTYSLDTGAPVCSKCFMKIGNSPFHKCLVNSDNDSDPDSSLHLQIPLDSKYSLNLKSIRYHKTSQNNPLSRSLDPKHSVGFCCPLHQEDSKYSLGSSSYLHCESCSAVQNHIGSTATHTFPMNPQNTMSSHSTLGPDNVINTSNVPGLENEGMFNLTAKLENEAKPDNDTKLITARNLKDKASANYEPLLKYETEHEDETDSEDEKDSEKEIDPEDENNTKDKKDPKDKSDPDDSDSKDSNAEHNADTNSGSDPGGDADPTSGADSNGDGDSNNGTDSNNEPDSNIDDATNNDANSKYSTDSDGGKHTINSDNTPGLDNCVDQDCTVNFSNGTSTNSTSVLQNGTGLNCTSCSNNGAGTRNATGSGNDICPNNGTSPNNRHGSKINISGLQNNAPDPQNIVSCPNSPDSSNNDSRLKINGPGLNDNSPGPSDNGSGLKIDPGSNYNVRPSSAISHNSAISSNKDADSKYDTKPTIAAGHNYAVVPNYDSDHDCVSRFTHAVGSSSVVNPNYIAKNSYAARHSSTTTANGIDTSNTTSCSGAVSPSYTAGTNCASGINHDLRLIHAFDSNFVTNSNYDATNIHNVHNSTSISNINNLSEPELEIGTSSSIPNIVYANSPTFAVGTNYTSTPESLITSEFSDSSKLGINYTVVDNHKFGACLKDSSGSMDSSSFNHTTKSKEVLDAKEVGFLKDLSRIQNPIGVKYPADLNFHSNSSIPLPIFDVIVEAEPPDVVKFAVSSGAVNLFFKWETSFLGIFNLK